MTLMSPMRRSASVLRVGKGRADVDLDSFPSRVNSCALDLGFVILPRAGREDA